MIFFIRRLFPFWFSYYSISKMAIICRLLSDEQSVPTTPRGRHLPYNVKLWYLYPAILFYYSIRTCLHRKPWVWVSHLFSPSQLWSDLAHLESNVDLTITSTWIVTRLQGVPMGVHGVVTFAHADTRLCYINFCKHFLYFNLHILRGRKWGTFF